MVAEQLKKQGAACATPTYQDIHGLVSACHRHALVGAVVGNPGTGKSTAVKAYAKSGRHLVYCKVRKAAASARGFLAHLNAKLGGGNNGMNFGAREFYEEVLEQLYRVKEQGGILILDEAQDLELEAKSVVRNLIEDTRIALCLVGNKDLFTPPAKRGQGSAEEFRRFIGRIGPKLILDKPMSEDIDALCMFHGLDGKEARKLMGKIATTGAQLHNVDYVVRVAREAIGPDGALTFEALKNAAMLTGALV